MTSLQPKRVPNQNELAFIHLLNRATTGTLPSQEEINTITSRALKQMLPELIEAISKAGLDGFWKVYDAFSVDYSPLKDWRPLIDVPAPAGPAAPISATPTTAKQEKSYQLQPLSFFKNRPKREWAVDHLLFDRGASLFIGDGGSGKSAFVLDLYLSRAIEVKFIGKVVKKAFVIWVAAESIDELYPRASAMLACNNVSADSLSNFLILDGRVPFNNLAEVDQFIQETQAQLNELGITSEEHSLAFVFDTYARCTPGADENSTLDTKIIADSILRIGETFKAHVTTIHHMNAQGRIRGNTALRDAVV